MIKLSWNDVKAKLKDAIYNLDKDVLENIEYVYGVPRGGIPPAVMVAEEIGVDLIENLNEVFITEPEIILVVDDIVATGKTKSQYYQHPFIAVHEKKKLGEDEWIEFPWERMRRITLR